jgi:hypothetical protein
MRRIQIVDNRSTWAVRDNGVLVDRITITPAIQEATKRLENVKPPGTSLPVDFGFTRDK